MGTLKDMIKFLESSLGTTGDIYDRLNEIQEQYNINYNNAVKVRNSEIEFLQDEFLKDSSRFPEEIRKLFKEELPAQTRKFDKNIKDLEKKQKELKKEIDEINSRRNTNFESMKKANATLDKREERLKAKVEQTESDIAAFNRQIDEMNSGFGFITNFFRMKKTENKKKELLEKRNELVEQIETIRNKWTDREGVLTEQDKKIQENWNYHQAEYSIISEKIENLTANREKLINRAAFNAAMDSLYGGEKYLTSAVKAQKFDKCKKCGSENSEGIFFCPFCGEPFDSNREDIEGSLVETGELNRIHEKMTEGIKGTVSFLALMKGIREGMKTFLESVKEVKSSQDEYSQLPTLKIDVPEFTQNFSRQLSELHDSIDKKYFGLHPAELAAKLRADTEELLNEKNIEKFFSLMGDELNRTTKEQW